jgi:hypothetical protein
MTFKTDNTRQVSRFKFENIIRSDDARGWWNMTTLLVVIRNFSVPP